MNSAIYADFESILLPCSSCDKEIVTTKKLNKKVPCGYLINVINNHNNSQSKHIIEMKAQLVLFVKRYVL